jgi:hypothetical protein
MSYPYPNYPDPDFVPVYPDPTYATVEEADAFLETRPASDWALWDAITDDDEKLAYLYAATAAIDSLPLRGRRFEPVWLISGKQIDINGDGIIQILEFPRFIDGVIVYWDMGVGPLNRTGFPIVPPDIKTATILEALADVIFDSDVDNVDRQNMKNQGVTNYSIAGAYSESLGKSFYEKYHIHSMKARQILARYVERRPKAV